MLFTGLLEHEELELLPACRALVVRAPSPSRSVWCGRRGRRRGVLPLSAARSGLAEVMGARHGVPARPRRLSFALDEDAVRAMAGARGVAARWAATRTHPRGAEVAVRERWSREGVADGVLAAAAGRELAAPQRCPPRDPRARTAPRAFG